MAKVGRPTKYRKEMIDTLDALGFEGEGMAEAAVALGICRDTFNEWQKEKKEFSDAVKRFHQRSQAWWETKGRAGIFGKTEGFNATGYIFQMKNRFPADWRDKVEHQHDGGLVINLGKDADKL